MRELLILAERLVVQDNLKVKRSGQVKVRTQTCADQFVTILQIALLPDMFNVESQYVEPLGLVFLFGFPP